jgi:predicted NBD/HSP70 family sugar kinase
MSIVVFEIGGSETKVALSKDGQSLDKIKSLETSHDPSVGLAGLLETINSFGLDGIEAVAGGIRGVMREDREGIDHDSLLSDWANISIVDYLHDNLGVPVFLENDTALGGLGESVYGAGQGIDIVVYHTISTGVGGVKIVKNEIDLASIGFEPGHQVLDIDRTILGADVPPTLENLVSGRAVEERVGEKPYDIEQEDVIWDELAGYLAQGLRNTILYWSPEAIILGGAMMVGSPRIPLESVRKATVAVLDGVVSCPFITTASLGEEATLYGALAFAQQKSNIVK